MLASHRVFGFAALAWQGNFFKNFGTILGYAVGGTLVSTVRTQLVVTLALLLYFILEWYAGFFFPLRFFCI